MFVQGLGHSFQLSAKQNPLIKSKSTSIESAKGVKHSDSLEKNSLLSSDPEREKTLQSIKSKIKSGFYSSNAVIEDLSHGFAKILDESM